MVTLDRRAFGRLLAGLAAPLLPGSPAAAAELRDLAGRAVELPAPPRRIVLLEARDLLSMALLHPNPASLVVGWAAVDRIDSDLLQRQYGRDPETGRAVAVVGGQTPDSLSLESLLALQPDLVVATALMDPSLGEGTLARQLQALGIPLLFSDAFSNRGAAGTARDPVGDLARLLRLWGAVLERQERAEAFIAFAEDHFWRIAQGVAGAAPRKTYLEVMSTYDDCCWAAGAQVWGELLALAGGCGLSVVDAPWYAQVAVEQLILEAPEVYIATGGAYGAGIRPAIAPGLDAAAAREGLRRLTERPGLGSLPAVRQGRVHGIWTGLVTAQPFNLLFVEIAAKWLHPELFATLEPEDTLAEINRRFLAQPLPGPCWISLADGD